MSSISAKLKKFLSCCCWVKVRDRICGSNSRTLAIVVTSTGTSRGCLVPMPG
ncbi:Uncharacterised protein [Mycobacterium tuberculosis]|uniref:Uncharacterized protein n=1 Tax=Mycobacterium tuberculosis TaxID=1773 RepID=A0A0U0RZF8_MYCTX|nr:Uncharacterised protein [Mycobacterium tuberculosis]COW38078.1 Uncharacterised protein [Mycobacterium tuberculosis]COW97171.1 Uncharacterised protein [Mycobacterium tuberculosis]COZ00897.1 Uncharacterised protein [Mycobacterium tuberculosis]CPB24130.1 Uncharacterised protein [Mycobacterium tuberculosis]